MAMRRFFVRLDEDTHDRIVSYALRRGLDPADEAARILRLYLDWQEQTPIQREHIATGNEMRRQQDGE